MRALKSPGKADTGNDLTGCGSWSDSFSSFDPFDPMRESWIAPGISAASAAASPNLHASVARPFSITSPPVYSLDNAQRVLSEEENGKPGVSTTLSTTRTTSTTITAGGTPSTSPFVINVNWDASVANAPAAFKTGIINAVNFLESQFIDAVTVNINVGFGEVAGYAVTGLGASNYWLNSVSYATLANAIKTDGKDATDASVIASLPAADPIGGNYWVTTAEAKALGLASPNTASVDGSVGFSSNYQFDYDPSDGISGGLYDFNGTALHELTEVMGRAMLTGASVGGIGNSYYAYDLLHYSAPGVRDLSASTPGYFSVDGGVSNLGALNTVAGGDPGDWASSMGNDSGDAFSNAGVLNPFGTWDLTAMDAIGWDTAGSVAPPLPAPPLPTPTPPAGVSISALAASLGSALTVSAPLATVTQVGGASGDTFTYTLGGSGAAAFMLQSARNTGTLMTGQNGLAGAVAGTMYALKISANDTTSGLSSPAISVDVVAGTSGNDNISLAALSANLGMATPTFVYGGNGNDTINGVGMTGPLWFVGGGGADSMTAGSGTNTFFYNGTSDSTGSLMDIISKFNVSTDRLDLTGLGTTLQCAGAIPSKGRGPNVDVIAAHSVGWQTSGANTFVYVNTSSARESIAGSDMKIELAGEVSLTSGNIFHM